MNAARLLGDMLHLTAMLGLMWRIWSSRSCAGGAGAGMVGRGRLGHSLPRAAAVEQSRRLTMRPLPAGFSLRMQELKLIVFISRYLDLLFDFTR